MIIKRLILAVVVAVLVFLICLLAGALLVALGALFPPAFGHFLVIVGAFLTRWTVAIGAIFGVLAFLRGEPLSASGPGSELAPFLHVLRLALDDGEDR